MRKTILIAAAVVCLSFAVIGTAVLAVSRETTSALHNVILLQKVDILRKRLLIDVETVQSEMKSEDTRFSSGPDTIIEAVVEMEHLARQCSGCHHTGEARKRKDSIVAHINRYESSISRVLTVTANRERLIEEQNAAIADGAELITTLHDALDHAAASLDRRTRHVLVRNAQAYRLLLVLVAIGTLGVAVMTFIVGRSLTEPVAALLDATRRLKSGDLDHRVIGLKAEFGEVAESFNEMASSLKHQMLMMQRTEQMAVSGRLAAGVAHEIKNPLAGIKTSLQVLAEELTLSEEDHHMFFIAGKEISRIEALMRQLLDYARPQKLEFRKVDVNEVMERAIVFSDQLVQGTEHRDGEVVFRRWFCEDLPFIVADEDKIFQVFLNLLLNGIDAMPSGGVLSVETALADDNVVVAVTDQGEGVAEEEMENIFHPFVTHKAAGTGLGLAITREVILQHGGVVNVSNTEQGGARFVVSLPVNGTPEEATS